MSLKELEEMPDQLDHELEADFQEESPAESLFFCDSPSKLIFHDPEMVGFFVLNLILSDLETLRR